MIEIHLDLKAVDVIRMEGFPEGAAHDEDIYDELMTLLWSFEVPTTYRRYLMAVGLYLSDNFETSSWRVVAFDHNTEVGRMQYLVSRSEPKPAPVRRRSRYERRPVI